MPIIEDDPRPAYIQIADELRERIERAELKPGDNLPSIRKITKEFQVAAMTAQKASKILEAEGLVIQRPGKGFIVHANSDNAEDQIAELSKKLETLKAQLKHMSARFQEMEKLSSHLEAAISRLQRKN